MNRRVTMLLCLVLFCVSTVSLTAQEASAIKASDALSSYIEKADDSFRWEVRQEHRVGSCDVLRLHMVSQTWQEMPWRHIVHVIKPDNVKSGSNSSGLLLISGGSWKKEWPENGPEEMKLPGEATLLATAAESFGSIIVIVSHVPHQPLMGDKFEDEIIADTFAKYMQTGDTTWPLLLPMVKSAIRAMDAGTAASKEKWNVELTKFTVTGASKRGWTTWLTSSIDPRVQALAPMVIDMLNMSEHLKLQISSWGAYSEQIGDYTELQLPKFIDTPPGKRLQQIVDPFQYRAKITQPKLLIFGTNDRYWPLESCSLYWDQLEGSKHLLYVPNKGHNMDDYPRVIGSLLALHRSQNGGTPLPNMQWNFTEEAGKVELSITSDKQPEEVRAWVAKSETRDFREAHWVDHRCQSKDGKHCYEFDIPKDGLIAVFGEAEFPQEPLTAHFSTNIKIFGGAPQTGK